MTNLGVFSLGISGVSRMVSIYRNLKGIFRAITESSVLLEHCNKYYREHCVMVSHKNTKALLCFEWTLYCLPKIILRFLLQTID